MGGVELLTLVCEDVDCGKGVSELDGVVGEARFFCDVEFKFVGTGFV